jgi:hypothetical protein
MPVMPFIENAQDIARRAMGDINPSLVGAYAAVIRFLADFPETTSALRGGGSPAIGSEAYIERQATAFTAARSPGARPAASQAAGRNPRPASASDYLGRGSGALV